MKNENYIELLKNEIEKTKEKQLTILKEIFYSCDRLQNDINVLKRDIDDWYCDVDKWNLVDYGNELNSILEKRAKLYNELDRIGGK